MAKNNKQGDELFDLLRERGVRRRFAKPVARLEGNGRRAGAKGAALAQKAVEDLDAAATEIRRRVLRTDARRSRGARKASGTRALKTTKRQAGARKGAQTRRTAARTRTRVR